MTHHGGLIRANEEKFQEIEAGSTSLPVREVVMSPEDRSPSSIEKEAQLLQACEDHDLETLMTLASTDGGFLNDNVRKLAWPIVLGCNLAEELCEESLQLLPPHREEEQIEKDVNRAFVYYPKYASNLEEQRKKQELSDVICLVLRRYPQLSYFQGYHDIVQVILLVLGPKDAVPVAKRLSLLRIRDFMLPAMGPATMHLKLLPAIVYTADSELYNHLKSTQPFYALSATLTLYAHDIQEYGDIARLFDFLLTREAVLSMYLYAATILERKDELLEISPNDSDMQLFHLSKLPQPLNIESLIERAMDLFRQHPPETLPYGAWRKISSHSVLKTTLDLTALTGQSLEQGQAWFDKQAAELARQQAFDHRLKLVRQTMQKYRRPTVFTLAAVGFGLIAWSLGKGQGKTWQALPQWQVLLKSLTKLGNMLSS